MGALSDLRHPDFILKSDISPLGIGSGVSQLCQEGSENLLVSILELKVGQKVVTKSGMEGVQCKNNV